MTHQRSTTIAKISGLIALLFFCAAFGWKYVPHSFDDNWHSFKDAQKISRETGKKIFVDVYADWCMPCKEMEKTIFTDAQFKVIIDSFFVKAKVNFDDDEGFEFKSRYNIQAIPTCLIVDEQGKEWKRQVGAIPPFVFMRWIGIQDYKIFESMPTIIEAKNKAKASNKYVLIFAALDGRTTDENTLLMSDPNVALLLSDSLISTFVLSTHDESKEFFQQFSISKKSLEDMLGLVIVMKPSGEEAGRFSVPKMMANQPEQFADQIRQTMRSPRKSI